MYSKEFEKEHEEREKRMDEKLKEATNAMIERNKRLDAMTDEINDDVHTKIDNSFSKLNKSVDNYCNTIKRFSIIMISLIVLITIMVCGFSIYLMFQL